MQPLTSGSALMFWQDYVIGCVVNVYQETASVWFTLFVMSADADINTSLPRGVVLSGKVREVLDFPLI